MEKFLRRNAMNPITISQVLLVAGLLFLASCSSSPVEPGGPPNIYVKNTVDGSLNQGEPLIICADNLQPGEYPVTIKAISGNWTIASQAVLTADANGQIKDYILGYDAGLWTTAGKGRLPTGSYTIQFETRHFIVSERVTIPYEPIGPVAWCCESDGQPTHHFPPEGYFSAKGLEPGRTYRARLVPDRREWKDWAVIEDTKPPSNWSIEVVADAYGVIYPIGISPYCPIFYSCYEPLDLVLDSDPFGYFNTGFDAVYGHLPAGLIGQDIINWELPPHVPIYTNLASGPDYAYTDYFTIGSQIHAWLYPRCMIWHINPYAKIYVVKHSATWVDGAKLVDVTEGIESGPHQPDSWNTDLILIWAQAVKGEYDVILDVDGDGKYDLGTDRVDGGPDGPGFVVG